MPKNPLTSGVGLQAMQQRLAGAKTNSPMKPPKKRPKTSSPMVQAVMPPKIPGRF